MAVAMAKLALAGALLVAGVLIYRSATAKPNEDHRNYEVTFEMPKGWKELPRNPNTLLLARNPDNRALLRCSATQVVSDFNPEPEMDSKNLVAHVVETAQRKQPEWITDRLESYHNGRISFEIFRKSNANKTIQVAMAVRGNTTVVVSVSQPGNALKASKAISGALLSFLDSVDLTQTDKWTELHRQLDQAPQ